MRGVVTENGKLEMRDIEEPKPAAGQVLVRTLTCGICGTDLHARGHIHDFLNGLQRSGTPLSTDPDKPVVFGHEFCAEILDHGPGTTPQFKAGTKVVGLPFLTSARGAEYVGYSDQYPGGFAERMVLTEKLLFEVPNGLAPKYAALTEPFSVGAHAVARANVPKDSVVMVVGCGPIGLAVIAALKARGIGPVIGMDYSPGRRRFGEAMGCDEVVDAAQETQTSVWARWGAGRKGRRAVVFECVGRPNIAQSIIEEAPRNALVVVVGNVLGQSNIDQVVAFNKELDICFSMNYSPAEFKQTLHDLAEGNIAAEPVVTGIIAPENIPQAFDDLADAERHAKIIVSFE
ncbi:MAG: zinc-binding dehydrogenase [Spongiibacteraceae bacterium]